MGEKEGGRIDALRARNSPPMATEMQSKHSPPVLNSSGEHSLPSGKEDWLKPSKSHCHFGTNFVFAQTRVALILEFSEIEFSTLDEKDSI